MSRGASDAEYPIPAGSSAKHEEIAAAESEVLCLQAGQRLEEQPGSYQQNQREGELCAHNHLAETDGVAGNRRSPVDRGGQRAPPGLQRRRKTTQRARDDTHHEGKQQDPVIHHRRQIRALGQEQQQHARDGRSSHKAKQPPGQCDEQALDDQLARDAAPGGSESHARGQFLASLRPTRQEKAGDVQACEHEQERRPHQQCPERPRHTAAQTRPALSAGQHVNRRCEKLAALLCGHRRKTLASRIGLEHQLEPRLETGLRFLRCDAGLQPAEDMHPDGATIERGLKLERRFARHHGRDPQRGRFGQIHAAEARRGDADHRHRKVVDEDPAPDDIAGAAESVLPVVVREHDDRMVPIPDIVGRADEATQRRTHAEDGEVRTGHHFGGDHLVLLAGREVHRDGRAAEHSSKSQSCS